jgi:hypothetical protein
LTRLSTLSLLSAAFLAASGGSALAASGSASSAEPVRIEVETPTPQAVETLIEAGLDVAAGDVPKSDVILRSREDRLALRAAGLRWRPLPDPRPVTSAQVSTLPSGRTTYRVWEDYETEMRMLARRYPSLVRLRSMGETLLGQPMLGLEIARNVWASDGRPAFVQYGLHHAREWPSGEWGIEYAIELLKKQGQPRYASLLRNTRQFIFPVVNVDGFQASRGAGPSPIGAPGLPNSLLGPGGNEYRRKNCRPFPGEAQRPCSELDTEAGVDLNRNYGYFFGATGTEGIASSELYRGPAGFSEPESENVRLFTRRLQPTVVLTHHTYSEEGQWLRQPSLDPAILPGEITPDEAEFTALGDSMATATGWASLPAFQLYPTAGATDDWNYHAQGAIAFTSEGRGPDFHSFFDQMVRNEWPGMKEAILRAGEASVREGSRIRGEAPPGSTLRITKRFSIPVCQGFTETDQCVSPTPTIPEILSSEMVVPASGEFSWRVNPSSRPQAPGETWRLTCQAPGGDPVSREVAVERGASVTVGLANCKPGPAGRPVARFRLIERAIAGRRAALVSSSTARNTLIVSNRWDLDGDGAFDDASGRVATLTWRRPGPRTVGLRSVDMNGKVAVTRRRIRVAPRPSGRPAIALRITSSMDGTSVVFRATGQLGTYNWDLDGDGAFDDGRGREVSRSYRSAGTYAVQVRLTDPFGRVATRGSSLTIARPSDPGAGETLPPPVPER